MSVLEASAASPPVTFCRWLGVYCTADMLSAQVARRITSLTIVVLQGYEADHADIDLLRLRNYTVGRKLTEDEVLGPRSLNRIAELFRSMKQFVSPPHFHLVQQRYWWG